MNNNKVDKTNCPCDKFLHPGVLRIGAGLQRIPRQISTFNEEFKDGRIVTKISRANGDIFYRHLILHYLEPKQISAQSTC